MFLIHTPRAHAETVARAVVAACRLDGWSSPVQPRLLQALFHRLLDMDLDFDELTPLPAAEVGRTLASEEERTELIQLLVVLEALCNPLPEPLVESVEQWASTLGVEERSLLYLRELARGELARAVHDFYRLNWIGDLDARNENVTALVERFGDPAYALTVEADESEATRWRALSACPEGSIGHRVARFYQQRGFVLPGEPGGANAALAQHDWIHVLADFGTTPLGEIEVVSFQTTATRTPGAVLGLCGAVALFDSGVMPAGVVTQHPPIHALSLPGAVERMAEAIDRGRACTRDLLLDVDFFQEASVPLEEMRAKLGVPPKSARVRELDPVGAGDPTPGA